MPRLRIWFRALIACAALLALGACTTTNPDEREGEDATRDDRPMTGAPADSTVSPEPTAPSPAPPAPLVMIAIDSLHPKYLELDREGYAGGGPGNWLMPNLRRLVDRGTWYPNATCYLPAATDMNHLNALAGASGAQTGIFGVHHTFMGWDGEGKPVVAQNHLSLTRDDEGRPVDTLFHAWKRAWPDSPTAFVAGKGWVAEMFRDYGVGVDRIVTGESHPDYIAPPTARSFTDPPGDDDGRCDPESGMQRLITEMMMERDPAAYPPDKWIVDAALAVFERERPGMAYILMAQMDDTGHALGAAWDPQEFAPKNPPYLTPPLCQNKADYQLVSSRDDRAFREAILDAVRETDRQFGRLIAGLTALHLRGVIARPNVVVLSDHSMVTHLKTRFIKPQETDVMALLQQAGLAGEDDVFPYTGCSIGGLYWREGKERVAAAKQLLLDHRAINPQTGAEECPWWVLDREEMKNGLPGVAEPGELYHRYFIETDAEQTAVAPDLVLLARAGWQLAVYDDLANLGMPVERDIPTIAPFIGGHGSVDTRPIMMAFALQDTPAQVLPRATRISDIAVTLAAVYGLEIRSTTLGADLRSEVGMGALP